MSSKLLLDAVESVSCFTEQDFNRISNFDSLDKAVEEACQIAIGQPKAFYLFMQRYTQFNGQAGSLVARLASYIGLSRDLFQIKNCEIIDEADQGLDIAAKVLSATIDEHCDKHHKGYTHRTLAQATLKTVGNYAELSVSERNKLATIPNWLTLLLTATANGYQGVPGDFAALIRAMGFHAASEILADREYTTIDRVVRHDNSNTKFDKYLKDKHGQINLNGKNTSAWYWIATHGSHKKSGVEKQHFEDALEALNLAMEYSSNSQEQMNQWVFAGFSDFVTIQQTFFQEVQKECLELIKAEMGNLVN